MNEQKKNHELVDKCRYLENLLGAYKDKFSEKEDKHLYDLNTVRDLEEKCDKFERES